MQPPACPVSVPDEKKRTSGHAWAIAGPSKEALTWAVIKWRTHTNRLEQAINCDDGDRAAKIIQDALGIENDDVCELLLREELAG